MSSLIDIIGALIESEQKSKAQLPRGLVVAYTPRDRGDYVDHRLVWSRKNNNPSENEDLIMESHFRAALEELGSPSYKVVEREFQTSLANGWGSSLLILRTAKVKQESLF